MLANTSVSEAHAERNLEFPDPGRKGQRAPEASLAASAHPFPRAAGGRGGGLRSLPSRQGEPRLLPLGPDLFLG